MEDKHKTSAGAGSIIVLIVQTNVPLDAMKLN